MALGATPADEDDGGESLRAMGNVGVFICSRVNACGKYGRAVLSVGSQTSGCDVERVERFGEYKERRVEYEERRVEPVRIVRGIGNVLVERVQSRAYI
jgi:hypothetical protein